MSRLFLALLGTPLVRHAERAVVFPTRKAMALLIYLALEPDTHPRDQLTALFWSESDAEQGRASLRGTLTYIRQALREPGYLIADRDSVRFDSDSDFEIDLSVLDAALGAARQVRYAAQPVDLDARVEQLRAAAQRIRGEFLEGFSLSDAPEFDDWVSLQRELWHRKASEVLDALSQWQFEGGELTPGLETTTRWVAFDVFNEAAHRRLMEMQLALGERTAALRTFDAYSALLARDLNAEPSPETRALAERARTHTFVLAEQTSRQADLPRVADVALVGRRREHLQLVNVLRAARRGATRIVLLEGEPGIGKTRLAREFLLWASAQGAQVLSGRALETSAQLPYQPLAAALRDGLQRHADLDTLLTRTWWSELLRLLPELADRLPNMAAPGALNEAEARTRLFEAVARLVLGVAARTPVVLFIDDVPWADAASLDLLQYAVRRWSDMDAPILLLCTARTEDLTQVQNVGTSASSPEQWFENLARNVTVTRLGLGPLDFAATTQLMDAFGMDAQARGAQAFGEQLFAETRGQPFFVLQVLQALTERKLITRNVEGKWSWQTPPTQAAETDAFLPPSLRALIRERLARLSPNARAICNAGAVLGDGFDASQANAVAALDFGAGLSALEETLQRGLVREVGERYFFAHDKIREAVYADTSQARRRALHRRALELLDAAAAPPAERARHALAAGENERAYTLLIAAGDRAMQVFAVRNALGHYERALSLNGTEASLFEKLGRAYEFVNEWVQARGMYESLLSSAREAQDAAGESIALNRLATVAAQGFFDLPHALTLLQQALAASDRSGQDARRAETEWSLSQIFFYTWELDQARVHAERALAFARTLGDADLTARGLNILAYIGAVSYEPRAQVEAQALESRALFTRLGNRVMEVECLTIIAIARVFTGFPNETLTIGQEGYALARDIENPWGQANCAYPMVFALLELDRVQEALELAQTGVTAARAAGHPPILVFNLAALGRAFRAQGDFTAARGAHMEAQAIAEKVHHPFVGELAALDLCADYALAQEWETAQSYARAALGLRKYERLYPGFTFWCETESLVRAGELEVATQDVEHFGEHIRDNERARLQYERALAVLSNARGDLPAAAQHLYTARELALKLQLPVQERQIQTALADI